MQFWIQGPSPPIRSGRAGDSFGRATNNCSSLALGDVSSDAIGWEPLRIRIAIAVLASRNAAATAAAHCVGMFFASRKL
jgi:hypothetical protein